MQIGKHRCNVIAFSRRDTVSVDRVSRGLQTAAAAVKIVSVGLM